MALVLVTRFYDLGSRPYQYDESIHAKFSYDLSLGSPYRYHPKYHGPILYYVTAAVFDLLGDSDATARMWPAAAGTALILLVLVSGSGIGWPQALLAASLLAVSPTILYYSRFLREDIPVALFTWAMVLFGYRYARGRRRWDAVLCALFVALALAQKESTFLMLALFASELSFMGCVMYLQDRDRTLRWLCARLRESLPDLAVAAAVLSLVYVAIFTSFFTNPSGVTAVVTGLKYWHHVQAHPRLPGPWWYYAPLLFVYELPILIAALGGLALMRRRDGFRLFLAGWSLGAFALFAWAQEKVPWLAVHIVLPLALLAGMNLGDAWVGAGRRRRVGLVFAIGLAVVFELQAGLFLAFRRAADPSEILVFDPATEDVRQLSQDVAGWARRLGSSQQAPIALTKATWPIGWYLRHEPLAVASSSLADHPASLVLADFKPWAPVDPLFQRDFIKRRVHLYRRWSPPWKQAGLRDVWSYLAYRDTFGPIKTVDVTFAVSRDVYRLASGQGAEIAAQAPPERLAGTRLPRRPLPGLRLSWEFPVRFEPSLLSEPHGVAIGPEGQIVIADSGASRLVVLDHSGSLVRSIGQRGDEPGQLQNPDGVATARDGTIYVADAGNHRIQAFALDGRLIWVQGGVSVTGGEWQPRSVAVARDGSILVGDAKHDLIFVLSPQGQPLRSLGGQGNLPRRFDGVEGMVVAPSGEIYVADVGNQRVEILDSQNLFTRDFPVRAWPDPAGRAALALSRDEKQLVATDSARHRLVVYATDGRVIGELGKGEIGDPAGIAVDSDGGLIVADSSEHRVERFAPGWSE